MPLLQSNLVHCIIAVSKGSPEIPTACLTELYSFLADAAHELGARQFAAGSSGDHIHLLVSVPPALALSTLISEIKTMSQRWMREVIDGCDEFQWADDYMTFSVGMAQVRETIAYIQRQTECHRKIDYQQEMFLFGEAYELGVSIRPPES